MQRIGTFNRTRHFFCICHSQADAILACHALRVSLYVYFNSKRRHPASPSASGTLGPPKSSLFTLVSLGVMKMNSQSPDRPARQKRVDGKINQQHVHTRGISPSSLCACIDWSYCSLAVTGGFELVVLPCENTTRMQRQQHIKAERCLLGLSICRRGSSGRRSEAPGRNSTTATFWAT